MLTISQSLDWTYLQTPQFSISTGEEFPGLTLDLSVKHGAVSGGTVDTASANDLTQALGESNGGILGLKLHETSSWKPYLEQELSSMRRTDLDISGIAQWLKQMLPAA